MVHHNVIFFFIFWIYIDISSGHTSITYLKGVPRLSIDNYTDYYISCSADGLYLQWQVDDELLTVFVGGSAGRVLVGTGTNFEYTATLLSSQPSENGRDVLLDSMLVISVSNNSLQHFVVSCGSDSSIDRTIINQKEGKIESTDRGPNIAMDFVLCSSIVRNKNSTYVFVCGTNSQQQFLTIDNLQFLFNQGDRIGDDRTTLSTDGNIVNTQSVLVARHPFYSTSIVFIPQDVVVFVTCSLGSHQVQLSSLNCSTVVGNSEPTAEPTAEVASQISTELISPPQTAASRTPTTALERSTLYGNTEAPAPSNILHVIGVPIGLLLVIGLTALVICAAVWYLKSRKGSKYLSNDVKKVSFIPERVVTPVGSAGTSQSNASKKSGSLDSMSSAEQTTAQSMTIPKEFATNRTTPQKGLQSESQTASEETCALKVVVPYGQEETEPKETSPKLTDELRQERWTSTDRDACTKMQDINSGIFFIQPKQVMLVGDQDMAIIDESPDEHTQESGENIIDGNTCAVYCSNESTRLIKKFHGVWLTGESSRLTGESFSMTGAVVAGKWMKVDKNGENHVILRKKNTKQRATEDFHPGIRVAAQCDEDFLDKFFAEEMIQCYLWVLSTTVMQMLTALKLIISSFIWIVEIIVYFQSYKSHSWVSMQNSLHCISMWMSKIWESGFIGEQYMSLMSSTSSW